MFCEADLQSFAWRKIKNFLERHEEAKRRFRVLNKPFLRDCGTYPDLVVFRHKTPWVVIELKESKIMKEAGIPRVSAEASARTSLNKSMQAAKESADALNLAGSTRSELESFATEEKAQRVELAKAIEPRTRTEHRTSTSRKNLLAQRQLLKLCPILKRKWPQGEIVLLNDDALWQVTAEVSKEPARQLKTE